MGYNNLLYIATVMTELHALPGATMPLLLVEEPEAHLHPQLQVRLAESLAKDGKPQTIVTSHSPTVAANVSLKTITVLHRDDGRIRAASLIRHTLTQSEIDKLQRLIDVTRASLFFAKGIIVVEGISEALLLPVLARRLGHSLEDAGVSVIPLCGVEFGALLKILGTEMLRTPASFVTDADPDLLDGERWNTCRPTPGHRAARVDRLIAACADIPTVEVCVSNVTLEYALAEAGEHNPRHMTEAWEATFAGQPQNLNVGVLRGCANLQEQTLAVWRAVCLADGGRRKAQFAQSLADRLKAKDGAEYRIREAEFIVPQPLENAIRHALGRPAI